MEAYLIGLLAFALTTPSLAQQEEPRSPGASIDADAGGGWSFPLCHGSCSSGADSGPLGFLFAGYSPSKYFSLGVDAQFAHYSWHAQDPDFDQQTHVNAYTMLAALRIAPLHTDQLSLHAQLGLGIHILDPAIAHPQCHLSPAPAAAALAGLRWLPWQTGPGATLQSAPSSPSPPKVATPTASPTPHPPTPKSPPAG